VAAGSKGTRCDSRRAGCRHHRTPRRDRQPFRTAGRSGRQCLLPRPPLHWRRRPPRRVRSRLGHPAALRPARLVARPHALPGAGGIAALAPPPPADLRVNRLKATVEEAQAALAREGIDTEPMRYAPDGLRLKRRLSVVTSQAFRDGLVEIQDEGSQLVAALVDAQPGMQVADYCA